MMDCKYVELTEEFREALIKFRKEREMTLRELAEEMDVSPTMLNRYEKGDRTTIRREDLEKIGNYIGITIEIVPNPIEEAVDGKTEIERLKEENEALKHLLRLTWGWE